MSIKKFGMRFIIVCLALVILMILTGACRKAPTEKKTLKIGRISFLQYPLGIDCVKGIEALAEDINKKGGLEIDGETYNIEVIVYDSKMSDETSRAAVEKLIYQDKVKFILGDETVDAWLSIAEENKVVTIADGITNFIFDTKHKYTFQGDVANTEAPELWGWFVKNYPDVKTFVAAHPDNKIGHSFGDLTDKLAQAFNLKMLEKIFYPPENTDFSVVGTKVKKLNPDAFLAQYGGPMSDSLCFKAAWQAGWRGKQFASSTVPAEIITQIIPPEAVEGMTLLAWATEMEPAVGAAKEFKDAYIAKHGKWDNPEIVHTNTWYILMAALKEADSIDPDDVADVLAKGLKYTTPCCPSPAIMVSRPDLGNKRTVDTMGGLAIKQIKGGKAEIIKALTVDEAFEYNKKFFGW